MHTMVFVIGDNPLGQVAESCPPGSIDWAGIGGRYSGMLILQPGAEGKRYGDTMPGIEASIAALIPDGVELHRYGARGDRTGVDQARASDVDWEVTIAQADRTPGVVVADRTWHDARAALTAEEFAACITSMFIDPEKLGDDLTAAFEKLSRWDEETLRPILVAAGQGGQLITVVDIHE